MNGIPITVDRDVNIDEMIAGIRLEHCPYTRRSWLWLLFVIKHPIDINNKALNIACVDM